MWFFEGGSLSRGLVATLIKIIIIIVSCMWHDNGNIRFYVIRFYFRNSLYFVCSFGCLKKGKNIQHSSSFTSIFVFYTHIFWRCYLNFVSEISYYFINLHTVIWMTVICVILPQDFYLIPSRKSENKDTYILYYTWL